MLMRGVAVASRSGTRGGLAARAVPFACLLLALGAGCGADAGAVDQSAGALEPDAPALGEPGSPENEAELDGEVRERNLAPGDDEPGPASEHATRSNELVLPSTPAITDPADEAPLPSAELETTRAIDSSEPVDVIVPPGDCRFEYLGQWVRCEGAGAAPVVETDADDLLSCMQRCLERDDCTGVTDYLWLDRAGAGCYLYLSTCEEPAFVDWGEDDGGHEFRRVCDD